MTFKMHYWNWTGFDQTLPNKLAGQNVVSKSGLASLSNLG